MLSETTAEVERILKTALLGDLGHRQLGVRKQLPGSFQSKADDILGWGRACDLTKGAEKNGFLYACLTIKIIKGYWAARVFVNIFQSTAHTKMSHGFAFLLQVGKDLQKDLLEQ